MSEDRDRVLAELTQRVGFPFSETELSPNIRKRIGELESIFWQADNKKQQRDSAMMAKNNADILFFVLLAIGIISLLALLASVGFLIVSVPVLLLAYYYYDRSRKSKITIDQMQGEIQHVWTDGNPRLDALSKDIFNELSAGHNARPNSQPAIQREIERETVKIRCPYCRTINPDSRANCSHCGARL
jgi:hypothetical protein